MEALAHLQRGRTSGVISDLVLNLSKGLWLVLELGDGEKWWNCDGFKA